VEVPLAAPSGTPRHVWRRISEAELPWQKAYAHGLARREALNHFCENTMGFTPMAVIDLAVPVTGLTGVAFVIPDAVPPGSGGFHRVYLKRMLLGNRVGGLVPEWAFFVRCAIDATGLAPTASREQLYSDDALLATQEALAEQVRTWVVETLGSSGSPLTKEFVHTHHLALRSLSLTDEVVLDLAAEILPFETTEGIHTLREIMDQQGEVVYTASLEEYRRVGAVARAQGILLVNGGYVYDADLMAKLATRPQWNVRALSPADIAQVLTDVELFRELEIADQVAAASEFLSPLDIRPVVRCFNPAGLPAMILDDPDAEMTRGLEDQFVDEDDVWNDVLGDLGSAEDSSRQLIFNDTNPTVRRWLALDPATAIFRAGLQSMYVSALLLSGEPLRSREAEMMNDSLETFLKWGLPGGERKGEDGAFGS